MGIKDVFRTAFPFISAAAGLGGPLGSMAANAVGKALGLEKAPSPDGIGDAIAAAQSKDPDAFLKLKQAEEQFALDMQKLNFQHAEDIEQIAAKDRDSARNREIQLKDWTPRILAMSVVATTFTLEGMLLFHHMPNTLDQVLLGRILGTLDSALILVLGYYFGSSAGSADKNVTIAKAMSAKE